MACCRSPIKDYKFQCVMFAVQGLRLISKRVHVISRLQLFITNRESGPELNRTFGHGTTYNALWTISHRVRTTVTRTNTERTCLLFMALCRWNGKPPNANAPAFVHVLLMAYGLICIKSMMAALALFRLMKFALNGFLNICHRHCWAFNNQF